MCYLLAVVCIEDLKNEQQVHTFHYIVFLSLAYGDHLEHIISEDLLEKQDLSQIIIISVSVIAFIILINVGLVVGCMFKKRAKRDRGLFLFIYLLFFCGFYYVYLKCCYFRAK